MGLLEDIWSTAKKLRPATQAKKYLDANKIG
jgi:hypothetical protein